MLVKIYLDGVKCNEKNITYDTISQICSDSIPKNINANILICSSAEGYVKELDRIIYYNKNFYCKKQSWLGYYITYQRYYEICNNKNIRQTNDYDIQHYKIYITTNKENLNMYYIELFDKDSKLDIEPSILIHQYKFNPIKECQHILKNYVYEYIKYDLIKKDNINYVNIYIDIKSKKSLCSIQ